MHAAPTPARRSPFPPGGAPASGLWGQPQLEGGDGSQAGCSWEGPGVCGPDKIGEPDPGPWAVFCPPLHQTDIPLPWLSTAVLAKPRLVLVESSCPRIMLLERLGSLVSHIVCGKAVIQPLHVHTFPFPFFPLPLLILFDE